MKKIALLLFISFFMIANPGLADAKMIMVDKEKANIRSGPGKEYKIAWSVPKYTPFEALCKYKKWYVVRDFEGDIGWVFETLVSQKKSVVIKVKSADIRSEPKKTADIIWKVEKGYPFKFIDKKGKWVNVQDADGESGCVETDMIWGLSLK